MYTSCIVSFEWRLPWEKESIMVKRQQTLADRVVKCFGLCRIAYELASSGLYATIKVKTTASTTRRLGYVDKKNRRWKESECAYRTVHSTRYFCPKIIHCRPRRDAYCKSQNNDRVESALQSTTVNIVIKLHGNRYKIYMKQWNHNNNQIPSREKSQNNRMVERINDAGNREHDFEGK